jgi:hypothetical protein
VTYPQTLFPKQIPFSKPRRKNKRNIKQNKNTMKTTRYRICTLGFALALAASSLHATTSTLPAPKPEFLNSE